MPKYGCVLPHAKKLFPFTMQGEQAYANFKAPNETGLQTIKDVPGGFPKSNLLGVTVALIHVVGQQFLAVAK